YNGFSGFVHGSSAFLQDDFLRGQKKARYKAGLKRLYRRQQKNFVSCPLSGENAYQIFPLRSGTEPASGRFLILCVFKRKCLYKTVRIKYVCLKKLQKRFMIWFAFTTVRKAAGSD
ncbi:MAG: hypothetical protein LUC17_02345, partial [Oscillospiraceae bacterium]|nr:hypothetical protein [Oscillospiraceae bacterium]